MKGDREVSMESGTQQISQTLRRLVQDGRAEKAVYVLSALLLFISVWLPPISAGARFFYWDYPVIGKTGGALTTEDGVQLLIPAGALTNNLRLKMTSLKPLDVVSGQGDKEVQSAVESLPSGLILHSPLYRFQLRGSSPAESILSIPVQIEGDILRTIDLYGWTGKDWVWLPAHIIAEEKVMEAVLSEIPSLAVVAQPESSACVVAAIMPVNATVNAEAKTTLAELNPLGLYPEEDGTIGGTSHADEIDLTGNYIILPVIRNEEGGALRTDVIRRILTDPVLRDRHISEIVTTTVQLRYPGICIDYRGLDSELRDSFSAFISDLAVALHNQDKSLTVRVGLPKQIAADRWETGAYDWRAIGLAADVVEIPALADPAAYGPGGQMEALLQWAVGEVNRSKLRLVISANSRKVSGGTVQELSYSDALAEAGQVTVDKTMVNPGEEVTAALSGLLTSTGVKYHEDSHTYWLTITDAEGKETQFWLENATSVAHKLQQCLNYGLGGVTVENLIGSQNDPRIWTVLEQYRQRATQPISCEFTVVWSVQCDDGTQISTQVLPLDEPHLEWTAPDQYGCYTIAAAVSDDGGRTVSARGGRVDVVVPTPTPTPTPLPTPTPTPKPQAPAVTAKATAGPGFAYGIQADMIMGDPVQVMEHVRALGMTWVKQQVEWFRYHPAPGQYEWGALDRIVDAANAYGINVLFSVVKAPQWSRPAGDTDQGPPADPNVYGEFLRAMAERYKGRVRAYEIWNEQNLYYEWGGKGHKLNAAKYVELLKVAYRAIKSVDPNAIVVSGALTPTGWNDGDTAIDDRVYLEQMYQAGLKNYCDAVGAHPSGYNNPPDATWQSWSDPATNAAKGHPSWFFRDTMEGYRNIMLKYGDGNKRIWPTEFGWASVEGLGVAPAPGYEYAADNTETEQAQFITRAFQMAKNWGWVGPMFLWNLNFGPLCGPADEKAAFGILRPNWSARPAYDAIRNMPK